VCLKLPVGEPDDMLEAVLEQLAICQAVLPAGTVRHA
jgi:hypothetical protein